MDGTEERLLGYGLAATGAAGALVWASGQLAGLAFGHTWMHVSPADVAAIMWHLPGTLSDPALAWPTPAASTPAATGRARCGPAGGSCAPCSCAVPSRAG